MNLGPGVKVWILKKNQQNKYAEDSWKGVDIFIYDCMHGHPYIYMYFSDVTRDYIYMHSFWKKMPDSDTELGHFSTFIFYTVQSAGY